MNRLRIQRAAIILFTIVFFGQALATVIVTDDLGHTITVNKPVQRIISLAPHTTELLFAAGAGKLVMGAVRYSNYPEAAKSIPRVGDTHNLDMEKIISLNPDLVVAWQSGNGAAVIKRLEDLGLRVYVSEPARIKTIAKTIRDLGNLTGHSGIAAQASSAFISELNALERQYAGRKPVQTFYQIWYQPLFTVNGKHLISEVIRLCGGRNIFHNLPTLSARVSLEAVLKANPEVIIASGADNKRPPWLQEWYRWPTLQSVKANRIFFIPPDVIQRQTPRILQGARMMCKYIDTARK